MITRENQVKIYKNEVVKDAISLIQKGESAVVYSQVDVASLKNIFSEDNLMVIELSKSKALRWFGYDGVVYFVSYSEAIIEAMAYAIQKLYILEDMRLKLSHEEKRNMLKQTTKPAVERMFWTLYDKYVA